MEKKFNVVKNDAGEVTEIEFNADAFIIPNRAGKLGDFWLSSVAEAARRQATIMLGKEPTDDDLFVEMWYVADDIGCENLVDHGASVEIDGKKYYIDVPTRYLPYLALKDKREGDSLIVTFYEAASNEDGDDINVVVDVTLKQKGYRYARFGSFEETLWQVAY